MTGITHLMMDMAGGGIADPSPPAFPQGKGGAQEVTPQVSLPGQGGVTPAAFHLCPEERRGGGVIPAAFHLDQGDQGGARPGICTHAAEAAEAPVQDQCQGLSLPGRLHSEHGIYAVVILSHLGLVRTLVQFVPFGDLVFDHIVCTTFFELK